MDARAVENGEIFCDYLGEITELRGWVSVDSSALDIEPTVAVYHVITVISYQCYSSVNSSGGSVSPNKAR